MKQAANESETTINTQNIYYDILQKIQKNIERNTASVYDYYRMIIGAPELSNEQKNDLMTECLKGLNSNTNTKNIARSLVDKIVDIDNFNFNSNVFKKCLEITPDILFYTYGQNPQKAEQIANKLKIDLKTYIASMYIYNNILGRIQNITPETVKQAHEYYKIITSAETLLDEQKNELILKCLYKLRERYYHYSNPNITHTANELIKEIAENINKFNFSVKLLKECYNISQDKALNIYSANRDTVLDIYSKNPQKAKELAKELGGSIDVHIYNGILRTIQEYKLSADEYYETILKAAELSDEQKNKLTIQCLDILNTNHDTIITNSTLINLIINNPDGFNFSKEVFIKCLEMNCDTLTDIYNTCPQQIEQLVNKLGISADNNTFFYNYALQKIQKKKLSADEYYKVIAETPELTDKQRNKLMIKCLNSLNNNTNIIINHLVNKIIENIVKLDFSDNVFKKCYEVNHDILLFIYAKKSPQRAKEIAIKLGATIDVFFYNSILRQIQQIQNVDQEYINQEQSGETEPAVPYCLKCYMMITQMPELSDEQRNKLMIKSLTQLQETRREKRSD